ncbi:hypothetical protein NEUTE1DRAFT_130301 [Neurospora tetrasperma FGSC 2508]|uniref:Uncharacterized protein n=1 Tax=Neurospora tetrasperma (strain FGSC 2508 / ATCC MYA-4615 / P0657) TaxID=510951 RepID=F8MPD1_NEUT8|nr:uncharacterized protein NEUTE1DRAFT_130301 [Neurospora tetrasperma FGSC 2508]EGO56296.1 hypothetical protein NEUTE1DRAFT_130301 [Neurospora tetrasperma FGSC 2508]EGZ70850.1 hypothetical protein NEUTE2DRAFT_92617 [Neurospora tetrasperma FGSC 2509]
MTIPWGTIRSLTIFFAPVLLPKAFGLYRNFRRGPQSVYGPIKVRPVPSSVRRALLLLLSLSLAYVALALLPIYSPENIFRLTQSRLQIPVDVLFTRLASIRPPSAADNALRHKFVNLQSRLLYLQFGPDVLASCPFCSSDDPKSYLYYALPSIVAPHLFNLGVIALVTSCIFTGRDGFKWRYLATMASLVIGGADVYMVSSYNPQTNARALRLYEIDFFHWRQRSLRFLVLTLLDCLLATLMYLSSTNRMFVNYPSPAERVETVVRQLQQIKGKVNAVGVMQNTISRDEELRARGNAYWQHEVRLMGEVMEERDVVEGVRDALRERVVVENVERDAEIYVRAMLPPFSAAMYGGGGERSKDD